MIFDAQGSGTEGNRPCGKNAETQPQEREGSSRSEGRLGVPSHSHSDCAITGPALLQTEQVLMRRAPEFVPIIHQIRKGGAIAVQSGDPDLEGTFNLYRVSTSPAGCKMIADVLAQTLEAQRGHPASLRTLVNIWQKLQQEKS